MQYCGVSTVDDDRVVDPGSHDASVIATVERQRAIEREHIVRPRIAQQRGPEAACRLPRTRFPRTDPSDPGKKMPTSISGGGGASGSRKSGPRTISR